MASQLSEICSKCGVASSADSSVMYYRFPFPTTNILKAKAWATYCWPDQDWSSIESLKTLAVQCSKLLCGRHFNEYCFTKNSRKNLKKHAVPGTADYVVSLLEELRKEMPMMMEQVEDDLRTGTTTDATTSAVHIDETDTQDQTTAVAVMSDASSSAQPVSSSSQPFNSSSQPFNSSSQPFNSSSQPVKRKYVMLLKLDKGCKPPKKMTKIDKSQIQFRHLRLVPQKQKSIHINELLSQLGMDELQDDPRSPSPEQDIEVNMCRICLQSFNKLISMESYGLRTAYEQLTGVSVQHDDELPQELCVECATLLDKYYKFREKSIRGDQLLRQIYNKDGVTEKFPLEEIEQAISNLASTIDFCQEVICVDIDPDDTASKVPETMDLTNDNTDLSKTSDNKVMQTDLDMLVDEPSDDEPLDEETLSANIENIGSPAATSVHDIDDEVSIKEEDIDVDGDNTDPLDSEDVNIQPETQDISVVEQPESQHISLLKDTEIQHRNVIQQSKTQLISLDKQPQTQIISQDQQPQTQLLSLLKEVKTRKSLITYPGSKQINLLKHPATKQINILKHPEKNRISLLKHPEKKRISLLKPPEKQRSLLKYPEPQHMSLVKQPETQHLSLVKQPETKQISLTKNPETQHMSLVKDPINQQESLINAHYFIHKLEEKDQKLKHDSKRMLVDYIRSKFRCEICNEGFKTLDALSNHKVHDADQGDVLCTICLSYFREPQDLKEHTEDVHQYIFTCRICKRDIITRTQALRHIKDHLPCIRLNS